MALEIAPNIVVDPEIRFGKPIIKGTRVPVELVEGRRCLHEFLCLQWSGSVRIRLLQ